MNFEKYKIIPNYKTNTTDLVLPNKEDISKCEDKFKINFEDDYIEYIFKYGEGVLGGTYVRVYLPKKIMETHNDWLERISEYWFWDAGKEVMTKKEALESVRIGDTFDGDEIIFYKNEYFILPRHSDKIYNTGESLEKTIEWLCSSGILTEPFIEREFEPFNE
ncbi:SMI1/KNR4 family protein [Aquimarina aggregata]|uniref:SMI1/KNR4 family protein n=1 Tax=Aquimarina aggregata TaxID=1642818 RepID=UPI00248F75BC|nr:SMI1/KNR4 family protein [Aquimarina aggregata]